MNDIISKIADIIDNAPEKDRNELAQLMEDYAERFPRTVKTLSGMGRKVWEGAEEACEARIEYR